jgi:hypothetical protein
MPAVDLSGATGPGSSPSSLPVILIGTGVAAAAAAVALLWVVRRRQGRRRPAHAHR